MLVHTRQSRAAEEVSSVRADGHW